MILSTLLAFPFVSIAVKHTIHFQTSPGILTTYAVGIAMRITLLTERQIEVGGGQT